MALYSSKMWMEIEGEGKKRQVGERMVCAKEKGELAESCETTHHIKFYPYNHGLVQPAPDQMTPPYFLYR